MSGKKICENCNFEFNATSCKQKFCGKDCTKMNQIKLSNLNWAKRDTQKVSPENARKFHTSHLSESHSWMKKFDAVRG